MIAPNNSVPEGKVLVITFATLDSSFQACGAVILTYGYYPDPSEFEQDFCEKTGARPHQFRAAINGTAWKSSWSLKCALESHPTGSIFNVYNPPGMIIQVDLIDIKGKS